jgi:hypothetical protein
VTLHQWVIFSPLRSFSKSKSSIEKEVFFFVTSGTIHILKSVINPETEILISENVSDISNIGLNYIKYFDEK